MTTRELLYVKTVADAKNISRAARKLFVAQPSLSQSLQRIEDNVGTKLFVRSPNGLKLTYAGEKYYQMACQVLKIFDDFESCSNIRYQKLDLMIKDINPIRLVGNHVEVEADKIAASINKYLDSELANGIEPGYDQITIALVERFDKPYGTGEKNSDDIIRKICVKEGYKTVRDVANAYKYNYDVIGYEGFVKEANYRLLVSLGKIDINNLGGLSYARK